MKKRLLVAISSHGFGHFSMTVPIINQLIEQDNYEIILRTTIPEYLIQSRIPTPLNIIRETSDFGMLMNTSLDVDLTASKNAYEKLHKNLDQTIFEEKQKLQSIAPDLILSNIPYVTLAAASELKIPCLAFCSLNWAHIISDYFKSDTTFAEEIIPQMVDLYNKADKFVVPAPSMEMPGLNNLVSVGPVCSIGTDRKVEILNTLNLPKSSRLVLVSAGGVATPIEIDRWPKVKDVIWVCAWSHSSGRSDIISLDDLAMPFPDLTASVDCIVTKPGYGTVSESACLGKPAIFVKRGDWAEEPNLVSWWMENALVKEVSRKQFFSGDFVDKLETLLQAPGRNPQLPKGVGQVVDIINEYL